MGRGIVIIDDPWDDKPLTQEQKEKLLKWFKFNPASGEDKRVAFACKVKDGRVQVLQEDDGESEKE